MNPLLGSDIRSMAQRSVLCWLATADASGQPNVTPKEIFAILDDEQIVVANIASPGTAKNIRANPKVCLSFIDVFAQKGYKVLGLATEALPSDAAYAHWVEPLRAMAGERFPIHSVFVVLATAVEPIVAPSYLLHPSETNEATQVASALRSYGVQKSNNGDI
jgi:predicted pyridoxine 5'-phosphate oxidase superfamily flavin-nucleotide-binding protein